jgi:hypothetical protein
MEADAKARLKRKKLAIRRLLTRFLALVLLLTAKVADGFEEHENL